MQFWQENGANDKYDAIEPEEEDYGPWYFPNEILFTHGDYTRLSGDKHYKYLYWNMYD